MLDGTHGSSSRCVDEAVLAAFIDGQLPATERAAVEAHLATCTVCSEISSEAIYTIEHARRRAYIRACVRTALAVAALVALAGAISLWLR
jgi:hypothetical protein